MLLRRWRDEDVREVARMNADPRVVRYLTAGGRPLSHADSEEQVARFERHWAEHGFGLWAVEEKASGRLVGRIGIQYHRLWPDDPEVGWKLDPAVWGRGYATEGGRASVQHAFETLGVPRVVSIVHPQNAPSIAVTERLGLALAGHVWWPEGDLHLLRYALERPA